MKVLLALCLIIGTIFQIKAQDSTKYYRDTVKTLIWYVVDLRTGASATGYALRITKSELQFVQPSASDMAKDSFSVKKQKVPIAVNYFIPIVGVDSAAVKKKKKLTEADYITVFTPIPTELVLSDFQKNFDGLIKQANANTKVLNKQESGKIPPKGK